MLCHYWEAIWLGHSFDPTDVAKCGFKYYVHTKWKCLNFPDLSPIYICLLCFFAAN